MPGRIAAGCLVVASLLAGALTAADVPGAADSLAPKTGDLIVFLGDSTTQAGLYTQYLEDFFFTRFPQETLQIVNAGVDGSSASDAIRRFSADVAEHHPTHVAVWLGMNEDGDAISLRDNFFRTYRHDLAEIDHRIREIGAVPIYMSPTICDARSARRSQRKIDPDQLEVANATSAYFGVWLQEFAEQSAARFVDLHGPLNQLTRVGRRDNPQFSLMHDGFRPAPSGHLAIAAAFLTQLGLEKPLSAIQIARQPEGFTVSADGGAVMNLQSMDTLTVSFLWQAEALPWIVPADTAPAGELLKLADRFNREILQVRGLAAGMYELLIDDRLIGRFSSEALDDGLDLQRMATPQTEQARRIAERNRERTEAAIRPAREEWSLVQEQIRLQQLIAVRPDDAELQQKLTDIQQKLEGFQDRQAKLSHIADELMSELRDESQPIPRQFVIRPVPLAEVRGRVLIGNMPISGAVVELHGMRGLTAAGTTDAMGFFQMTARSPDGIEPGAAWLVVLAKMVLPKFVSLEQSGHRVMLRSGVNEIELHFEEMTPGQ